MSKKTSTTSGNDQSKHSRALKAADKAKINNRKKNRWGESGNVFFTLFGAVAIVGVLGAGIMSTMRGPLSTMVEVNRREQAKSELRVAASLVLANSDDESLEITCAGEAAGDGYTEGPAPTGTGPTGGGVLPAVGASQNDPWGNAYGYCAWNHGDAAVAANTDGCGTVLGGTIDTNNIAIAVMSAGPDGVFQTSCVADNSGTNDYVEPDGGGGDDIVEAMTYNQAISGSGGLWTPSGATTATIDRDIDLTATSANLGGVSPQLRLGAASMLLPTDDTAGTGDADCAPANNLILRINDDPSPPILEICDGANTAWESVAAGANLWTTVDANSIYYQGGTPASTAVGINVTGPDDTLDVGGTIQATGAVDFDSTLNVDGNATLRGTADVTGNFNVNTNQFSITAANGNMLVAGTSTLNNNVTITGTTADGSTDPLTINDSGASSVFIVSSDGEVDATGYINTADAYLIDAVTMLSNATGTDGSVLLGQAAGPNVTGNNNTILGANAAATLTTGTNNIIIGHNADVPLAATADYLNIGGAITGSLTTGDVTVAGDLTITGNNFALGTVGENVAGRLMVGQGTNFASVAMSGDVAIAANGATTIQSGAVDRSMMNTGAGSSGECLKYSAGGMIWQACSGGGGGDGVGTDGFTDLSDTPSGYAGAAADANKVVVVNGAGTGLVFVDADSLDSAGKWADATEGNDIKYNVDADNDVLIGADSSAAVSLNANASADLHVAGIIQTASRIYNAAGAEATPSYSFTSDPNSGIYSGGADILGLVTGGTSRINLLANGDVGVGTATVATGSGASPQNLLMEVNGPLGATNYCDEDGEDCFVASDVGTGIWEPDGTNDYIEYDDTLGGVRIGKITGQPAPATDWSLDVGNSIAFTSNSVAIGSSAISTGDVTLNVDITGNLGATNYCDEEGDDCFTAAAFAALAGGAEANNLETVATNIADTEIFIGTGANAGNYAAISGDATLANTGALTISAGVIEPSMLDAVGAAGAGQDEFCLTYEHGSTEFEWVSCSAAAGGGALDDVSAADGTATIANGDNAILWNWATTTAGKDAFTFGETTASTATGESSILKAATLASSTATPLMVTNLGNAHSFRVNDETGDADTTPFVIDASGKVGVGTPTPAGGLHVYNGGADSLIMIEGPEDNDSGFVLTTSGDAASFADGNTSHWNFTARGNNHGTATEREDFLIEYWDSAAWTSYMHFDESAGSIGFLLDTALELPGASFDVNGTNFLLPAPSAAVVDGNIDNSQWTLWLDEGNDEFELKAKKADGTVISATVGGGGGTPSGADTQVQFNDGGAFGGDAGFVYVKGTDTLTIGSTINVGDLVNIGATTGAAAPTGVSLSSPTIAANAIEESMLKAVDAAADEECLTYESTTGDFEWQACGGGGAINDLSDAATIATDYNLFMVHTGGSVGADDDNNTGIGFAALDSLNNSGGDNNTAIGPSALTAVTSGDDNIGIGNGAAIGVTTGSSNLAIGTGALDTNTIGSNNTAIGYQAIANSSNFGDLDNNTAIGYRAGYNIDGGTSGNGGNNNILLGYQAGDNITTGDNNIIIGYDVDPSGATAANEINIGGTIYGYTDDDRIGIGALPDAGVELDVTGDIEYSGTLTDTSDRRLKDNITPLTARGSMIEKIAGIDTYSFTMKEDADKRIEFGVMAQELEEIFPELVHTAQDEMGTKSVNYVGLIAPMIEATKEVHAENQMLKAELSDIKAQVELLNKATANNAGKASIIPTNANAWLYVLLGMLGSLCIVLLINRKPAKAE